MKINGMKRAVLAAICALYAWHAEAATTLLPNGKQCFSATTGINGMLGLLGSITGGAGYVSGTYGNVPLTGGSGTTATANITVTAGVVTAVIVQVPGKNYVVGDVLSASNANLGGAGAGFSIPVASISVNASLAGGSVNMYVPATTMPKTTWQDAGQVAQNTNPITLDGNGCAVIYGVGSYRQQVLDSLGNLVWDQVTTDTSATNNVFWAGLAGGTPNAITVNDAGFNGTDGSIIQFIPISTNTAATTLNPSGFGAIPIVKDTGTGATALSGNEIVSGAPSNVVSVVYVASQANFHLLNLVNPATQAQPQIFPQGYLTLLSAANGGPIQATSDVTAATSVFYSPYVGSQIPIYNGSVFLTETFTELTLSLTNSAHLASTAYDVCIALINSHPTVVTGPAWSNSGAGTSARGSGPGSAQIQRLNGIWVNANQITGVNGSSSFTIPINQCTYVGSILIDAVAGQISAHRTYGQNRKFGPWNAYNRVPIVMKAGITAGSYNYNGAFRFSFNTSNNGVSVFTGLQEEIVQSLFLQEVLLPNAAGAAATIAFSLNGSLSASGTQGVSFNTTGTNLTQNLQAQFYQPPLLGLNTYNGIEACTNTTCTFNTQEPNMSLIVGYRG